METSEPNLTYAQQFAEGIHRKYPEKMLAYNLSSSFNWDSTGMSDELAKYGYHLNGLATTEFVKNFARD